MVALPLLVWAGVPALGHQWESRLEWLSILLSLPLSKVPSPLCWLLSQAKQFTLSVLYNASMDMLTAFQAWGDAAGCGSMASCTLPWA